MELKEMSIIIKTFHRKYSLFKLLDSINTYLNECNVLILDDGYISTTKILNYKYPKLNITVIRSKKDIGNNYSRNLLLNLIQTDYFLYLDDDYLFLEDNNLLEALKILANSELDILGGKLYDVFEFNSFISILTALKKPYKIGDALKRKKTLSRIAYSIDIDNGALTYSNTPFQLDNDYTKTDHINNFYIAKTSSVKAMGGWLPNNLKTREHRLFFIRAKLNGLNVGYTDIFCADHVRYIPLQYLPFRLFRLKSMEKILSASLRDLGINHIVRNWITFFK